MLHNKDVYVHVCVINGVFLSSVMFHLKGGHLKILLTGELDSSSRFSKCLSRKKNFSFQYTIFNNLNNDYPVDIIFTIF